MDHTIPKEGGSERKREREGGIERLRNTYNTKVDQSGIHTYAIYSNI